MGTPPLRTGIKKRSMKWYHRGSPPPRKFRVLPSTGKVMVTIFWDAGGILMVAYLERGHTKNNRLLLCQLNFKTARMY